MRPLPCNSNHFFMSTGDEMEIDFPELRKALRELLKDQEGEIWVEEELDHYLVMGIQTLYISSWVDKNSFHFCWGWSNLILWSAVSHGVRALEINLGGMSPSTIVSVPEKREIRDLCAGLFGRGVFALEDLRPSWR